jgi:TolB protein
MRPRPRWLALIKERPMRADSLVAVGSPTLRFASVLAATLLLMLLSVGAVVAGATLLSKPAFVIPTGHNGLIAFDSGDENIYLADPDGTNPRLFLDRDRELRGPTWSPDGTRLAFFEMVQTDGGLVGDKALIHIVNGDGGGDIELTGGQPIVPLIYSNASIVSDGLVWSPDSTRLALAVVEGTNMTARAVIAIAHADGSGFASLPIDLDGVGEPSWSPDGAWLAFRGYLGRDRQALGVYVSRPDGSDVHQVTSGDVPELAGFYGNNRLFTAPRWSPVGDPLLYAGLDKTWVVNSDGSQQHVLLDLPAISDAGAGDADWWPTWSPDGRHVAIKRWIAENDHVEMYVADADGSNVRLLDPEQSNYGDHLPMWAPDSTAVLTFRYVDTNGADGWATRPTILSLDESVGTVDIDDPNLRDPDFNGAAGISWQRLP